MNRRHRPIPFAVVLGLLPLSVLGLVPSTSADCTELVAPLPDLDGVPVPQSQPGPSVPQTAPQCEEKYLKCYEWNRDVQDNDCDKGRQNAPLVTWGTYYCDNAWPPCLAEGHVTSGRVVVTIMAQLFAWELPQTMATASCKYDHGFKDGTCSKERLGYDSDKVLARLEDTIYNAEGTMGGWTTTG